MNIGKTNSVNFNGKLCFVNSEGLKGYNHEVIVDTSDIERIYDNQDLKYTLITSSKFEGDKSKGFFYKIPYKYVAPEKVMAAYTAACQNPNVVVSICYSK